LGTQIEIEAESPEVSLEHVQSWTSQLHH